MAETIVFKDRENPDILLIGKENFNGVMRLFWNSNSEMVDISGDLILRLVNKVISISDLSEDDKIDFQVKILNLSYSSCRVTKEFYFDKLDEFDISETKKKALVAKILLSSPPKKTPPKRVVNDFIITISGKEDLFVIDWTVNSLSLPRKVLCDLVCLVIGVSIFEEQQLRALQAVTNFIYK